MARLGVASDVADRILNHQASSTNSGVKAVYQVHSFATERETALKAWAEHIMDVGKAALSVTTGDQNTSINVTTIRRAGPSQGKIGGLA